MTVLRRTYETVLSHPVRCARTSSTKDFSHIEAEDSCALIASLMYSSSLNTYLREKKLQREFLSAFVIFLEHSLIPSADSWFFSQFLGFHVKSSGVFFPVFLFNILLLFAIISRLIVNRTYTSGIESISTMMKRGKKKLMMRHSRLNSIRKLRIKLTMQYLRVISCLWLTIYSILVL